LDHLLGLKTMVSQLERPQNDHEIAYGRKEVRVPQKHGLKQLLRHLARDMGGWKGKTRLK